MNPNFLNLFMKGNGRKMREGPEGKMSRSEERNDPCGCGSGKKHKAAAQFYSAVGWGTTATAPVLVVWWIIIASIIMLRTPAKSEA